MVRHNKLARYKPSSTSFYAALILVSCVLYTGYALTDDEGNQKKLNQLKTQISKLQSELELDNKHKDKAVYLLQIADKDIAIASKKLRSIEWKFRSVQKNLESLNVESQSLTDQIDLNHEYLATQIQASYAMGKQEYVKLLLNQQNPSSVARMVVYYQYFNQSRAQRLQFIDVRLSNLKTIRQKIERKSEKLSSLKQLAINEREMLKPKRDQQQEVIARLSLSLNKKGQTLKNLLRDELHLKQILDKIESQLKDVQLDLTPPKEFEQMKGQLLWPATGNITAHFGTARKNSGNLKWKGVVIKTGSGENINAVAYGRVVFADWLRGFGMLLIIDHGKGYMSLYGHNEQLHKKLGDWVQASEMIATSGRSGGQLTTNLYFEIRRKGVPQNPVKWCKSLPRQVGLHN
jgi:septal ring factor EnvC (AmiA/AmiB activator)